MENKSLIEKLESVIKQHYEETGERVKSFDVQWIVQMTGEAYLYKVNVSIEK